MQEDHAGSHDSQGLCALTGPSTGLLELSISDEKIVLFASNNEEFIRGGDSNNWCLLGN